MKKLSNGRKVIIYTVLLMTAFILSNYVSSGAKYYKTENDSITYNLGFDALTKEGLGKFSILKGESTHSRAYFKYTVPRNTIMTSLDTSDNYRILVNSDCEIKKVNGNILNNVTNMTSISYSNNQAADIIVEYSCPVDKLLITNSTDSFDTDVTIYEQMTSDYKDFIYLKQTSGIFKLSQLPAEIIGDYHIISIPKNNVDDKNIRSWLENYASTYSKNVGSSYSFITRNLGTDNLINYFKKGYNPDISNYNQNLIRGIEFKDNEDNYLFTINDDYLAYAITDLQVNSNNKATLFFFADINKDPSNLKEMLEYYVDKYLYSKLSPEYSSLMNYIDSNGGITAVFNNSIPELKYSNGRLAIMKSISSKLSTTTNITNTASHVVNINKAPSVIKSIKPVDKENTTPSESTVENIIVNKILNDYKELISTDNIKKFIQVDKDLIIASKKDLKLNDYIIYNIDNISLLINIYTDDVGKINTIVGMFDEISEIDLATATKLSIATAYVEDYNILIEKFNNIANIIDSKYATQYRDIIKVADLTNYEVGKGLYIYLENNIIKAYLKNDNDEYNFGVLFVNKKDDEVTNTEGVNVPIAPDKVVSGDKPNDDIPIFDDLTTTEPSNSSSDDVVGDNETVDENPETQEEEEKEETKEVDDNSKVADTDIEKAFVEDIEEVEKFIEEVKEYVGDAKEVSHEEEAIEEVSELIETVKDYINEV